MVLLSSVRIPRVPTYSGYPCPPHDFAYGTFTLFGAAFQPSLTILLGSVLGSLPRTYCYIRFGLLPSVVRLSNRLQLPCSVAFRGPYPARIATCGLGYSDFARHYSRNRFYFLFLRVLRCFSSPGSPHLLIYSVNDTATLLAVRSRIRTSADLCSFAAPRGFSQLVTSFLGAMYHRHPPYALRSLIFFFLVYSSLHIQKS